MIFFVLFTAVLVLISFIDIKYKKIPNLLIVALAIIAVASWYFSYDLSLVQCLLGAGFMFVFLFVIRKLSRNGLGMGDVKLMTASGFMLGIGNSIYALFIGVVIAGIYCLIGIKKFKLDLKGRISFGPFLSIGVIAMMCVHLSLGI